MPRWPKTQQQTRDAEDDATDVDPTDDDGTDGNDDGAEIDDKGNYVVSGERATGRAIGRRTRRDLVIATRPAIRAQSADLDAIDADVLRLAEIADRDDAHAREERERIGSHLRILVLRVQHREASIAHRLRLREYQAIMGCGSSSARAEHATVLGKIVPRPISLPDVDLPTGGKGSSSGLG